MKDVSGQSTGSQLLLAKGNVTVEDARLTTDH